MSDLCIVCKKRVRERQQAVECDKCENWQHRTCGTGITQEQYREAIQANHDIPFTCQACERRNPTTDEHGATFVVQTSLLSEDSSVNDYVRDASADADFSDDEGNSMDTSSVDQLNQPFNLSTREINQEPETQETDVGDEPLSTTLIEEQAVTYNVFETGSKRGKPLLVGSDGFRYNIKKKQKYSVLWTCSLRSVKCQCYATIVQKGNEFTRGRNVHQHGPEASLDKKVKISVQVKQEAKAQPYKSSGDIAKGARDAHVPHTNPNVPLPDSLARKANRYRAKFRPAEPKDLHFNVDQSFLQSQDFLVADIWNGPNARHLVFATQTQLDLLSNTKRWFMDGTFKVVGEPFSSGQLSSIHGFITHNGKEKQVPMAFILMSRRRTDDYVKVLTSIRDALDHVIIENVVMDFEQAAWLAVRQVFPGVTIKGCVFHFTTAVWRKVQDLGLKPAYLERASVYSYIRSMMALPFLPAQDIEPAFRLLAARANTDHVARFVTYMDQQWMNHPIFDIESLSVYGLRVRTNNDTEGWHHALNRKAGGQSLSFYRLIPALRGEAEDVLYQLRYLRDGQSTRRVRPVSRNIEASIREAWAKYAAKGLTTSELLAECAKVYGPQLELTVASATETLVTRL